ncbi:DgyrCDS12858 [Dimorphilus gyrociliatus]|uniref:DgyrCDS12858 n=1 Tax=Dimorphilus gyrociliatus TaxID=2664684 RepID=A0A7I8W8Y2_9ANNE|nr:DgyrCDS12858 [Dimorphilus gyrociliatus]
MNIVIRFFILLLKFIIDAFGDILVKFGLRLEPLTFETVCKGLSKQAKSDLLQTEYAKNNFMVLIEHITSCDELPLTGHYFTRVWMIKLLELRVRVQRCLKEDPSIYKVPLTRPVFFVTLMRTGSTFLHHLLSQDKNWRCPELWELEDCAPPPGGQDDSRRIAESRLKWNISSCLMGWKDVQKTHTFDPRNPEDLAFIGYLDGHFVGSSLLHRGMEGEFTDYFRNQSEKIQDIYEENNRVRMQMICKNSDMTKRRLLAMHHTSPVHLRALLKAFPDAQIITIHRDFVGQMKSSCELIRTISRPTRRLFIKDNEGYGRRVLNSVYHDAEKLVKWRRDCNFESKDFQRFVDVHFKDLIKNPIETVQQIYNQLDQELTTEAKENMTKFLSNHKKSNAKAKYNIEEFGLTENQIRQKFKFYTDYFKVKT